MITKNLYNNEMKFEFFRSKYGGEVILILFSAIYGYSFCKAAKQAFLTLGSNALRLLAVNSIGDFVLFLGKVMVIISTVLISMSLISVSKP